MFMSEHGPLRRLATRGQQEKNGASESRNDGNVEVLSLGGEKGWSQRQR